MRKEKNYLVGGSGRLSLTGHLQQLALGNILLVASDLALGDEKGSLNLVLHLRRSGIIFVLIILGVLIVMVGVVLSLAAADGTLVASAVMFAFTVRSTETMVVVVVGAGSTARVCGVGNVTDSAMLPVGLLASALSFLIGGRVFGGRRGSAWRIGKSIHLRQA